VTPAVRLPSVPDLSRAGRHSSSPSANSGTRHNDGTGPLAPDSSMRAWTVTRTSRRAAANSRKASGNSARTADRMLAVKPLEP